MDERCIVVCLKPYQEAKAPKGLLGGGLTPVYHSGRAGYVVQVRQGRKTITKGPYAKRQAEKVFRQLTKGR